MNEMDIPRLYSAVAEWLACIVYIVHLPKAVRGWRLGVISGIFLYLQILIQMIDGKLPLVFWIPGMLAAFMSMFLFLRCTVTISGMDQICYAVRAFILAEFLAACEWQIHIFYLKQEAYTPRALFLCGMIYLVMLIVLIGVHRLLFQRAVVGATKRETMNTFLIGLVIFSVSNLSFLGLHSPFQGTMLHEIFYVRTLIDLCGIIILMLEQVQHVATDAKLELNTLELILRQQYDQYCQTRDSIFLINRKYHDLKHQIHMIRSEQIPEKREGYLSDLESGIKLFEAQFHTGNSILDTILSGKAFSCMERKIRMQVIVDGELLSFMEPMDLCSLFGNALDNAIEYLSTVENPEQRLLIVNVCRQNNFILIRFENYCCDQLIYENKLPKSTKGNQAYHGFGVKSIQFVAEKYGGTCVIRQDEAWFRIHILIPYLQNDK